MGMRSTASLKKEMEGGNAVSVSERNYAFAVRRTNVEKCVEQRDEAGSLLGCSPSPGYLLALKTPSVRSRKIYALQSLGALNLGL